MDTKDNTNNMDYFQGLTGHIPAPQPQIKEEIGERIKRIREEKNISLSEISKITGFDTDTLSMIESNEIQPQLGTVIKLSKALDSAFSSLISGVGDKRYSITRKTDRKTIQRSTSQKGNKDLYTYKSLAPEVKGRHMEALIVQLKENPDKITSVHDGEEFIYVLEGDVTGQIGEDDFDLSPGDSVYYLSMTPHLIAAKNKRATILAVVYEG